MRPAPIIPFAAIDKSYKTAQSRGLFPDLTLSQFAELANARTGTKNYEPAVGGAIETGAKRFSAGLDDFLQWTGIPEQTGRFGEWVGEKLGAPEAGRMAGEYLPRGVINMAPMLLAAPFTGGGSLVAGAASMAGLAGTAGMTALDVFEKTDSPARSVASGAVAAAVPFLGPKVVGAVGSKVLGPDLALKVGEAVTRHGAIGLPARVASNMAGTQAVATAGDVVDIALAPEREMPDLLTRDYWAYQTVANLAFMPLDVVNAAKAQFGAKDLGGSMEVSHANAAMDAARMQVDADRARMQAELLAAGMKQKKKAKAAEAPASEPSSTTLLGETVAEPVGAVAPVPVVRGGVETLGEVPVTKAVEGVEAPPVETAPAVEPAAVVEPAIKEVRPGSKVLLMSDKDMPDVVPAKEFHQLNQTRNGEGDLVSDSAQLVESMKTRAGKVSEQVYGKKFLVIVDGQSHEFATPAALKKFLDKAGFREGTLAQVFRNGNKQIVADFDFENTEMNLASEVRSQFAAQASENVPSPGARLEAFIAKRQAERAARTQALVEAPKPATVEGVKTVLDQVNELRTDDGRAPVVDADIAQEVAARQETGDNVTPAVDKTVQAIKNREVHESKKPKPPLTDQQKEQLIRIEQQIYKEPAYEKAYRKLAGYIENNPDPTVQERVFLKFLDWKNTDHAADLANPKMPRLTALLADARRKGATAKRTVGGQLREGQVDLRGKTTKYTQEQLSGAFDKVEQHFRSTTDDADAQLALIHTKFNELINEGDSVGDAAGLGAIHELMSGLLNWHERGSAGGAQGAIDAMSGRFGLWKKGQAAKFAKDAGKRAVMSKGMPQAEERTPSSILEENESARGEVEDEFQAATGGVYRWQKPLLTPVLSRRGKLVTGIEETLLKTPDGRYAIGGLHQIVGKHNTLSEDLFRKWMGKHVHPDIVESVIRQYRKAFTYDAKIDMDVIDFVKLEQLMKERPVIEVVVDKLQTEGYVLDYAGVPPELQSSYKQSADAWKETVRVMTEERNRLQHELDTAGLSTAESRNVFFGIEVNWNNRAGLVPLQEAVIAHNNKSKEAYTAQLALEQQLGVSQLANTITGSRGGYRYEANNAKGFAGQYNDINTRAPKTFNADTWEGYGVVRVVEPGLDSTADHTNLPGNLGWVRFNLVKDGDGKKIFEVIELQSDKAQKGMTEATPLTGLAERLLTRAMVTKAVELGADRIALVNKHLAMSVEGHHQVPKEARISLNKDGILAKLRAHGGDHKIYKVLDFGSGLGSGLRKSIVVADSEHQLLQGNATTFATLSKNGHWILDGPNDLWAKRAGIQVDYVNPFEDGMRAAYDERIPEGIEKMLGRGKEQLLREGDSATKLDSINQRDPRNGWRVWDTGKFAAEYAQKTGVDFTGKKGNFFGMTGRQVAMEMDPITRFGGEAAAREVTQRLLEKQGWSPEEAKTRVDSVVGSVKLFERLADTLLNFGELVDPQGQLHGLASSGVSRAVYLAKRAGKLPRVTNEQLLAFGMSHEVMGHQFENVYKQGGLSPETRAAYENLKQVVADSTRPERFELIKHLYDELMPSALKADRESLNIMLRTADSPDEFMANIMGMVTMATTHGTPSRFRQLVSYLPQRIGDFIIRAVEFMRDTFTGGRSLARQFVLRSEPQLRKMQDLMTEHYKELQKLEVLEANFARADHVMPGGMMRSVQRTALDPVFAQDLVSTGSSRWTKANGELLQALGLTERDKTGIRQTLSRIVQPILNAAEAFPHQLGEASKRLMGESVEGHGLQRTFMSIIFADRITPGGEVKVSKNNVVSQVIRDKTLSHVVNEIQLWENKEGKNIFYMWASEPGKVAHLTDGLNDKQLTMVKETMARLQEATRFGQGKIIEMDLKVAENLFATMLHYQLPGTVKATRAVASELFTLWRDGYTKGDVTPFFNRLLTAGIKPEQAANFGEWMKGTLGKIAAKQKSFESRTWWVTERHMKPFHVSYRRAADKSNGRQDFNSPEEALAFVAQLRKEKGTKVLYANPGYRDMSSRGGTGKSRVDAFDSFYELLDVANAKSFEPLYAKMGLSADQIEELGAGFKKFRTDLMSENVEAIIGEMRPSARHAPGRENLNMIEQQLTYLNKLSKLLPRRESDSWLSLEKRNPEILSDPKVLARFGDVLDGFNNFRTPDTRTGQRITLFNFLYFMGMNLSTGLIEATQFPVSMAPMLREQGAGFFQSFALPTQAMGLLTHWAQFGSWGGKQTVTTVSGKKVNLYAKLMNQAQSEGRIGLGLQQEVHDTALSTMADLGRLASGHEPAGNSLLSKTFGAMVHLSSKFYGLFTHFNERLAILSSFEFHRQEMFGKKKLNLSEDEFEQVWVRARHTAALGNSSAGRVSRPAGLFGGTKEWRTVAQAMWSLNSYNAGLISNLHRYVNHGFGKNIAGLSPKERSNARAAARQAFVTLTLMTGVIGAVPFAGPMLRIMENMTDLEPEREVRDALFALGNEINGVEGGTFMADMGTHGLAYAMGMPLDVSQRVAVNGVLGFNSFEGWSPKALMGPTLARYEDYMGAAGNVMQGNVTQAVGDVMPVGFKKLYGLWQNKGVVTEADGDVIYKPTMGEQVMMGMGFQPAQLARMREQQRIRFRAAEVRQKENNKLYNKVIADVEEGNVAAAQRKLMEYRNEKPGFDGEAGIRAVADMMKRREFGLDPYQVGTQAMAVDDANILRTFGQGLQPQADAPQRELYGMTIGDQLAGQASMSARARSQKLYDTGIASAVMQQRGVTLPAARGLVDLFATGRPDPFAPDPVPFLGLLGDAF